MSDSILRHALEADNITLHLNSNNILLHINCLIILSMFANLASINQTFKLNIYSKQALAGPTIRQNGNTMPTPVKAVRYSANNVYLCAVLSEEQELFAAVQ